VSSELGTMRQSDTIGELAAALAKAQGEMESVHKDGRGPFGKYATLDACMNYLRPLLSRHGLSISQTLGKTTVICDGVLGIGLTTQLMHSSGEWVRDEATIPFKAEGRLTIAQVMGSGTSYGRRYALGIVGLTTDDDDDAEHSGPSTRNRPEGNEGNDFRPAPKPSPSRRSF
jgi:hypothetical protein